MAALEYGWSVTGSVDVLRVLQCDACYDALVQIRDLIPCSLRGVQDPTPQRRDPSVKWCEKTLIDKGLPMGEYLKEAVELLPRSVTGKGMGPVLQAVVKAVAELGGGVIRWRAQQERDLKTIAKSLGTANAELQKLVPEHGKRTCAGINFAFLYVVCEALEYVDRKVVDGLLFGFIPVGVVPPGGRFRPVDEPDVAPFSAEENSQMFDQVAADLAQRFRRAGQKGVQSEEWQELATLWRNVVGPEGEVSKGHMDGGEHGRGYSRRQIWDMYKDCPGGPRCLLRFGVEQGGKLRGCDDGARCGHNDGTKMGETIHCVGADLPAIIAREFAKWTDSECWVGTDDVEAAYRRVLNSMPQYTVVALLDPETGQVRYFPMPGFPFGLKSAVVAFNRVEELLIEVSRVLVLVPCGHYYDDAVTVEPRFAGRSGQKAIWMVHEVSGIPFAEKKHERMRGANPFLGIVSDFACRPGFVEMRVKKGRKEQLLKTLDLVLERKELTGAQAASLRGKLYFTSLTAFGGVGRAPLQALAKRQYSGGSDKRLDDDLERAVVAMRDLLDRLPPRLIPLVDSERDECIYIWSDAMWEPLTGDDGEALQIFDEVSGESFYIAKATLAFTVYRAWTGTWAHSYRDVGIDILRQLTPGKKTYIGQLEALAAAAVVHTLPPEWLAGRDGFMWIDNMGAKYSLQKGSARKEDSARIVDSFSKRVASLGFRPWFEYVPSAQNVADLPSRDKWFEYYSVIGADEHGLLPSGKRASEWIEMNVPDVSGWSSISSSASVGRSPRKRRRGK
jgi:hypothetical protein